MTKDTKTLILILSILVVCFGGLFTCMKIYMVYFDAKFFEQVNRIEVGMSFENVKEILPYRIYRECIEQKEVEHWADTKDEQILKTCHLYYFVDPRAMQYILVYVDKETQTVRHISTQHM
ncbi:MAG: hypothetical protein ACYTEU_06630 [Planctomycetota bacterium]|jgi:hypothetical protein